MTRTRTNTRSTIVLGVAGLLLGGAAVGSITTSDDDLSRDAGFSRLGDLTFTSQAATHLVIDGA